MTIVAVLIGFNGCLLPGAVAEASQCIQHDDMNDIYPHYDMCDMIVSASPLYFWTITARLKAFLE